ncbi:hypothetical protein LNI98_09530 [Tenacibaculum dicentrarchi]|nr:hypothetical protein [Tenacibaculum dicentrarchi]MCD8415530.1 hypothetical protein [Tenacibaculum dicentrarchi]MCD8420654.1 hypothetical protein [Tenacibaculum dicentrarchi]MCD8443066.1 hypothetical protein [Tenacibaculum dicentrarchi]MCD8449935.1 hypothetical protein [Tenacibaculum dicentrarchi]
MNAPLTSILKNDGVTSFFDVSYLTFNRLGDKNSLKQNMCSAFNSSIKRMNKIKEHSEYLKFVDKYNFKYQCHQMIMSKKGKSLKGLGVLSIAQRKKAKKVIECLVSSVTLSKGVEYSLSKKSQYLAFVTLTLPSLQVHSDTSIRKLLTRYIENLQKTYNVEHYVWKAEAQKNGNIHFHLIIDKYIHWSVHRKIWNFQLDKLGYLDAFFVENGHRNPNGVQAVSLKNKRSVTNYLLKYMTKMETGKRPILGKIWGCANVSKKLDYPRFTEGSRSFDALQSLLKTSFKKVVQEDYFNHYVGRTYSILEKKSSYLWSEVKKFFQVQNGVRHIVEFVSKPFIRMPKGYRVDYETNEDANRRILALKRERVLARRIAVSEKMKLVTYDPYKANQLDIFAPL